MDLKPASQERLWQAVRSVEPTPGAKARVLVSLENELGPSPRRRLSPIPRLVLVGFLVAGSTLAAVGLRTWRASQAVAPAALPAVSPPPARGRATASPQAPVTLAEPEATLPAPAIAEAETPALRADHPRHRRKMTRADGDGAQRGAATAAESAVAEPSAPKAAGEPTELSRQVAMYRTISAMSDRNAALEAWRGMLRRWPSSTLRHEIELNIIDALSRLGRREEARRAAAAFLRHFPKSPRAAEMKTLLGP